ncbi:MAG: cation-translocating P-type ATPase family protein [Isosphaeraceae bacterium]|nr:cation-translocating P-type ATPase family protein [Isosphaeraceae bacterium]
MHREYHPSDMHHLRAHAFEEGTDHAHHEEHRSLYTLTAVMGILIGGDVVLNALGLEAWRAPWGLSLIWAAALLGAARIVYGALAALFQGRIGADIALAQACLAALVIGQPFVAAEVVFIALVGEVLEAVTFERTQRALHRLLDQAPRTARVRRDGIELEVPAAHVAIGDLVIVRPGERIPVDGPVVAGRSAVDQAALTGESLPVDKGQGDHVYSGTLNQFGVLDVRAEKVGHETTFGQVLRLVADAQRHKAPLQRTADRLARWFLPVVEGVAAATLLAGYALGWPDVWFRTVAVLVVACPCALVLATPAAVLASMAWLARHGVLIKGGAALERLAECDTFAFDKTGTLTRGQPELAGVAVFDDGDENEMLRLAASAESASRHPLALAITREAQRRGLKPSQASEAVALPGAGVSAACEGRTILVGNARLMAEQGVALGTDVEGVLTAFDARGETPLIVAIDGRVAGLIGARDAVRPEAHDVVRDLKHLRISEIAILTGDPASAARALAKRTDINTVEAELLPEDKARWVELRQASGRKVAMVGDGINDAPALARAHAGIALGGIGADLAAEAGDLVILGEPLSVLPDLVQLSRATVRVIRQNILIFAFGFNAVAMASAALGVLGPVPAAILHQAGSLLVLLNAMRLLVHGDWAQLPPIRFVRRAGQAVNRLDDRLDLGDLADALFRRGRMLVGLTLAAGALVYLTWGWTAIGPEEVGLVRRQGRYVGDLQPGLHYRWPPPFETVTRLAPAQVRSLEVGFRTGQTSAAGPQRWESAHARGVAVRAEDESLVITGDGQLVEMTVSAHYRLDPARPETWRAFAFGVAGGQDALRPLAEAVVREVVGRRPLDALLTRDRHDAEVSAARLLQDRIDAYRMGLIVTGVSFQDVHPPVAVVDAYRDVSRAESDRQRRVNEGDTYQAEALATAKGIAAVTVNRAEALRVSQVARASGEGDAFVYQVEARASAPALTDLRLYWEMIASTFAGKSKVVLDSEPSHPRRLIVPGVPPSLAPPVLNAVVPVNK